MGLFKLALIGGAAYYAGKKFNEPNNPNNEGGCHRRWGRRGRDERQYAPQQQQQQMPQPPQHPSYPDEKHSHGMPRDLTTVQPVDAYASIYPNETSPSDEHEWRGYPHWGYFPVPPPAQRQRYHQQQQPQQQLQQQQPPSPSQRYESLHGDVKSAAAIQHTELVNYDPNANELTLPPSYATGFSAPPKQLSPRERLFPQPGQMMYFEEIKR